MDFDDLFENKKHHPKRHHYHYHNEHPVSERYMNREFRSNYHQDKAISLFYFIEKIKQNKKLKLLVIVSGAIILAIAIVFLVILIPLVVKFIKFISEFGIQGVLDSIAGFLNKLWNGSGK